MSDRARIASLTTLVQSAKVGGYTLPPEITDAHAVWQRLQQAEIPPPRPFSIEDAAGRIVHAATTGQQVDPLKLCRDFQKVEEDRRLYDQALGVMRQAIEQAAAVAVNAASDATERIITEHLRPVHDELMQQARDVASVLRPYTSAGFELDLQRIVSEPSAEIRAAYLALPDLVERRRLIWQARTKANQVGQRKAEHDEAGLFALFERPMTFHPHWRAPAQIPRLPMPEDDTARLLWFASDEATTARPWLPTLAEQDAAWWGLFGERLEQAARNRHDARAMAEQAVGIERRDGTTDAVPAAAPPRERQAVIAGRLFGTTAGGVPVNGGAVER
jgi:hypothetical protein